MRGGEILRRVSVRSMSPATPLRRSCRRTWRARRTENAGHACVHRLAGRGYAPDGDDDLPRTDVGQRGRRARKDLGHRQTTALVVDGRADPRVGAAQLLAKSVGLLSGEVHGVGIVQGGEQAVDAGPTEARDVDRAVVVALQVLQDLAVEVGLTPGAGSRRSARQQSGEAEAGGKGEGDDSDGEQSSCAVHGPIVPARGPVEPTACPEHDGAGGSHADNCIAQVGRRPPHHRRRRPRAPCQRKTAARALPAPTAGRALPATAGTSRRTARSRPDAGSAPTAPRRGTPRTTTRVRPPH